MSRINSVIVLLVFATTKIVADPTLSPIEQLQAFLRDPANTVEVPQFLFHWSKEARHDSLTKSGKLSNDTYKKSKGTTRAQLLGQGVYVSTDGFDSEGYGPKLVVFKLPKGSRTFMRGDSDLKLLQKLKSFGYKDGIFDLQLRKDLKELGVSGFKFDVGNIGSTEGWAVLTAPDEDIKILSAEQMAKEVLGGAPVAYPDSLWLAFKKLYARDGNRLWKAAQLRIEPRRKLMLAARRFMEPDHFLNTRNRLTPKGQNMAADEEAYHAYGKEAFKAWLKALKYIEMNAHRKPTVEDFLKLHAIVYNFPGAKFMAYGAHKANRKIEKDRGLRAGGIPPPRGPQGKLAPLKVKPLGVLRDGDIYFRELEVDGRRRRIFTESQVEAIEKMPWFQIYKKTRLGNSEPPSYKLVLKYPDPENFPEQIEKIFGQLHQMMEIEEYNQKQSPSSLRVGAVATPFYLNLVGNHYLWDGNGRTAKLMRDWVYLYFKTNPPLDTPTNDLTQPQSTLLGYLDQSSEKAQKMGLFPRLFHNCAAAFD